MSESALRSAPTESPEPPTPNTAGSQTPHVEELVAGEANTAAYEEEGNVLPEEGDVLEPGDHLIELEMHKACPREVLAEGFRQIGFTEVLFDQSVGILDFSKTPPGTASPGSSQKQAAAPNVRTYRFIGRLTRAVTIRQADDARWTYARGLRTDILSNLRLTFMDHPLVEGRIYETRFLARMRAQPTRAMVENDLDEMGWKVLKLSALRRDMRLPERQNASVTLWFGVLRWEGVDSYVSDDDPFYFEEVI